MKEYHIRIESREDGVIGEWDVPGFFLMFDPGEDDCDLRTIKRNIPDVSLIGMLETMKAAVLSDVMVNIVDGPPLLDN